MQEYRGDLGIALTDVVGMDAFLADFDLYFAKLFDGLRHDSGDPVAWAEKALAHYQRLRVDARTKRLVFSDGLDVPAALALHRRFSLTGYYPADLLEDPAFLARTAQCIEALRTASRALPELSWVIGAPTPHEGVGKKLHNSLIVVKDGQVLLA